MVGGKSIKGWILGSKLIDFTPLLWYISRNALFSDGDNMQKFTRSELEEAFSTLFGENSSQKTAIHKGKTYKIDVGWLIAAVGSYVIGSYAHDPRYSLLGSVFLLIFFIDISTSPESNNSS